MRSGNFIIIRRRGARLGPNYIAFWIEHGELVYNLIAPYTTKSRDELVSHFGIINIFPFNIFFKQVQKSGVNGVKKRSSLLCTWSILLTIALSIPNSLSVENFVVGIKTKSVFL